MEKVIFTIIGTVIGAGFASGQEIYTFFLKYGQIGLIGVIISNLLTGYIIYKVLTKNNKNQVFSYRQLLEKTKLSIKTKEILIMLVNIFLIMSFYIMIAGFAAYFKQEFNIPKIITVMIISTIAYITFKKRIEGITKINNIIIPILIGIIVIIGFRTNFIHSLKEVRIEFIHINNNLEWIIKAIEYSSYNSILLIPILISIKKYSIGKEKSISLISTLILSILSTIIFGVMYKYSNSVDFEKIEMPIVYIVGQINHIYKYIYGIVIIFSIYSTMISAGYGLLENVKKEKYGLHNLVLCLSGVVMSNISFSNLINIIYPIFGILGIFQLILIFFRK